MKRQINRLTPFAVRNATKDLCDGYGLWLQVSEKYDTKSWLFRFMLDGKANSMGLGPLNTTSLAKARVKAETARDLLAEGINPREHRNADRRRGKLEAAKAVTTFRQCAEKFIAANRVKWKSQVHALQWEATFNETRRGRKVFPAATAVINDLPVASIDTALVLRVLEPLWSKTPETASRIRGRIELVLDWAKVRGEREGENPARWRGHLDKVLPNISKVGRGHHAALPYLDLPAFMANLRAKPGVDARALELCVLTAARTGELMGARWSEIDLQGRQWVILGSRMKAGKEHRVPLSDRAVAILEALPRDGEVVFPGGSDRARRSRRLIKVLNSLRRGMTTHGFRSTFRDWAAEQTSYPNELCEIALAHAVSDKTEAAYRRGDMMEKRRRLMADWARFCEAPPAERDNVVAIGARTA